MSVQRFTVMVTTDQVVSPEQLSRILHAAGTFPVRGVHTSNGDGFTDVLLDVADKESGKELAHKLWGRGLSFVAAVRVGIHGEGPCPAFVEEPGCIFERQ